jgi:thioredoxin reductase (NADPH)
VVGGGNSTGQAAMHIARYARKVSMVIRGDGLKQTLSQYLVDRILAGPQIEVLPHTEVSALHGDHVSSAITLTNRQTGQQQTFNTRWLFSCLGGVAAHAVGRRTWYRSRHRGLSRDWT